jgi:hypothetical protein
MFTALIKRHSILHKRGQTKARVGAVRSNVNKVALV